MIFLYFLGFVISSYPCSRFRCRLPCTALGRRRLGPVTCTCSLGQNRSHHHHHLSHLSLISLSSLSHLSLVSLSSLSRLSLISLSSLSHLSLVSLLSLSFIIEPY